MLGLAAVSWPTQLCQATVADHDSFVFIVVMPMLWQHQPLGLMLQQGPIPTCFVHVWFIHVLITGMLAQQASAASDLCYLVNLSPWLDSEGGHYP
jgi:hypothetical protein